MNFWKYCEKVSLGIAGNDETVMKFIAHIHQCYLADRTVGQCINVIKQIESLLQD